MALRIAVVGLGKIAHDQHLPAIAASSEIELAAVASPGARIDGVPAFDTFEALLAGGVGFDAVAVCTPPQVRYTLALAALRHGKHVLLEKPPTSTLGQVTALASLADAAGLTLFTAWHSRFAAGVEPARSVLAGRRIASVEVDWREDVGQWHPDQPWIWKAGGLGVFDPGVNALSILERILPQPFVLTGSRLTFEPGSETPIAAELTFESTSGAPIGAHFDFREKTRQRWDIAIATDQGPVALSSGGARLSVDDAILVDGPNREYAALYRHFATLCDRGESDVVLSPSVHVSDALLLGAL